MSIGQIVTVGEETTQYVVVGFKDNNAGDYGACSHNEVYQMISVEDMALVDKGYLTETDIKRAREVRVTGITATPKINVVKDVAPFEIIREVRYNIRRKQAKQVTVYE